MQNKQTVLAVDLDHSLIDTDMIYLGLRQLIYKKIHLLPYVFYLRLFNGVKDLHIWKENETCLCRRLWQNYIPNFTFKL